MGFRIKESKAVPLFQHPMQKGYIIGFCSNCNMEIARLRLPEDTEHLSVKCEECNKDVELIHISVEEINLISKEFVKDDIRKEMELDEEEDKYE